MSAEFSEQPLSPTNALNPQEPFVAPTVEEAQRSPLRIFKALVLALRPKQSPKNLFVFAALVFVGKLFDPILFGRTVVAFLLFTIVAGSIYLLNDILDVEQDRLHPKKRYRPIASGALPVAVAWAGFALIACGGLAASFWLQPLFGVTVLAYFSLQIAYCLKLKHVVLVDVFTIALGFVLRAVAGGMVIGAGISHWLLLCTLQLALFLGFGKRRQELVLLGEGAGKHRAILNEYGRPLLDQIINVVVGVTIVCYSVYSVESDTAKTHPHLWITVPVVIFALFRYMYLVHQKGWGGAPDEVLQKDRGLQVTIGIWLLLVLLLLKFDRVGWAPLGRWTYTSHAALPVPCCATMRSNFRATTIFRRGSRPSLTAWPCGNSLPLREALSAGDSGLCPGRLRMTCADASLHPRGQNS